MDDVRVSLTESDGGWTAEVVVTGGGSSTQHEVTLSRDVYERLADDGSPSSSTRSKPLRRPLLPKRVSASRRPSRNPAAQAWVEGRSCLEPARIRHSTREGEFHLKCNTLHDR